MSRSHPEPAPPPAPASRCPVGRSRRAPLDAGTPTIGTAGDRIRCSGWTRCTMAYQTWGTLNPQRDNAVLVLHALTGDSHVVGPAGPDQPTPGLVGRADRARRAAGHRPVLRRRRQRARRLPRHHRAVVDRPGRPAVRIPVPADHRPRPGGRRGRAGRPAGHRTVRRGARRLDGRHAGAGMGGRLPGPGGQLHRASPPARSSPATRSPGASRNSRPSGPTRNFAGGDYYDGPAAAGRDGRRPADRAHHLPVGAGTGHPVRPGHQGDEDPLLGGRYAVQSYLRAPRPTSSAAGSTRTPTWC